MNVQKVLEEKIKLKEETVKENWMDADAFVADGCLLKMNQGLKEQLGVSWKK